MDKNKCSSYERKRLLESNSSIRRQARRAEDLAVSMADILMACLAHSRSFFYLSVGDKHDSDRVSSKDLQCHLTVVL